MLVGELVDLHVIEEIIPDVDTPGIGVNPCTGPVGSGEEHAVEIRGSGEITLTIRNIKEGNLGLPRDPTVQLQGVLGVIMTALRPTITRITAMHGTGEPGITASIVFPILTGTISIVLDFTVALHPSIIIMQKKKTSHHNEP